LVASLLQQQSAGPRTQQLTHQEERKFDARLETALSERLPTLVTNLLQQHIAGRLVDELIHHQKREFDKRLETALCDELPTVVANLLQQQALPSKPWSEVHHRRPESQDTSEPKDGNSEAVSSDRSANCPEHNSVQCQHGEKSQFSMPSCMAARENLLPEKGPLATDWLQCHIALEGPSQWYHHSSCQLAMTHLYVLTLRSWTLMKLMRAGCARMPMPQPLFVTARKCLQMHAMFILLADRARSLARPDQASLGESRNYSHALEIVHHPVGLHVTLHGAVWGFAVSSCCQVFDGELM